MGIAGDETQGAYKFTTAGEEIQINVIPFKEVVKVLRVISAELRHQ